MNDLEPILEGLRSAAASGSDDAKASLSSTIPDLISRFSSATEDEQVLILRILGNAVADYDENRSIVLASDLPRQFINSDAHETATTAPYFLGLLFNLCNGYQPAVEQLLDDRYAQCIESHMGSFLKPEAPTDWWLLNLQLFIDSGKCELLPDSIGLKLLETDLELADFSGQVVEIIPASLTLLSECASVPERFSQLLNVAFHNIGTNTNTMNTAAVIAMISYHEKFYLAQDEVSLVNGIDRRLSMAVLSEDPNTAAIAAIVLSGAVVNAARASQLVAEIPGLVEHLMSVLFALQSPYFLQAANLVVKLCTSPEQARLTVDKKGVSLVDKLLDYRLFPDIRYIGVRLASGLLSYNSALIAKLVAAYEAEDNERVKMQIAWTLASNAEVVTETNDTNDTNDTETVAVTSILLDTLLTENAPPPMLLRVSKGLGVLSSKSPASLLDGSTLEKTRRVLQSYSFLKEHDQDATLKGVLGNIAYVAGQLQDTQLADECQSILTQL